MQEISTRSPTSIVETAGADLGDRADALVAEDASLGDGGDVALEDVQVGAADRRGVDPDDHVRRLQDRRVRDLLPRLLAGTVVDERLHD